MKGFIGSANVDSNSRLCMASAVAGHRRAFGADIVPGVYADIDQADLIVLVGTNAAWCHPVLFQRMLANKHARGAKLVLIDPRRTATAEESDLFLPIAPGADGALFCALLVHLADRQALDRSYVDDATVGLDEALARSPDIAPDLKAAPRAGGLANQLAAHMGFSDREVERVGRFWKAPRMARAEGLKAVQMFEAIAAGR